MAANDKVDLGLRRISMMLEMEQGVQHAQTWLIFLFQIFLISIIFSTESKSVLESKIPSFQLSLARFITGMVMHI